MKNVDGRRTPDHGYTMSSPCEPEGSGELKMFKLRIRNMEREDIKICQITKIRIFLSNPRSRLGSEVCLLAPQHVLDVPLPYFPKLTT